VLLQEQKAFFMENSGSFVDSVTLVVMRFMASLNILIYIEITRGIKKYNNTVWRNSLV
jgi:hypothetical protein